MTDAAGSKIVLHVEYVLKPGIRDAYVARALQHRETVMANEPGCLTFEVSLPDDDENAVRLYEVYADEAAFDHHMKTPYMDQYRSDIAEMTTDRKATRARLAEG